MAEFAAVVVDPVAAAELSRTEEAAFEKTAFGLP